jgi:hypothetical protein
MSAQQIFLTPYELELCLYMQIFIQWAWKKYILTPKQKSFVSYFLPLKESGKSYKEIISPVASSYRANTEQGFPI